MAQRVNYTSRNFADIRTDLVNMVRQYYPDIFNDFNDASVGMMLLELNAAVGDMLSFNTDRLFQETQIDYAQERSSILSMARTFGLNVPAKRPSITILDFSITVPVLGDGFDITYCPLIQAGAQGTGSGKVFESLYDIDFSSPFSIGGIPNRIIVPNRSSNGTTINYTLTKREIAINGFTKYYQKVITPADVVPFLEVILPDNNVTSVESVIALAGTNYTTIPTYAQFLNNALRWYQVDALAEDKVFIEDFNALSDNPSVRPGKYIKIDKKFITEYTDNGFLKLIFGGGNQDITSLTDFDTNPELIAQMGDFINNLSLGVTQSPNTTLFVKYKVGGGLDTNVGQGVITSLGLVNMTINGADANVNNLVKNSLKVNNPVPALGGKNQPSVEEIRNLVRYNFSAQNRAVTIKDYQSRIALMPGQFGAPFRCGVFEEQNKIKIYILGLNNEGKLTNTSTSTLKNNIATYLSDYRMLNDYIEVTDAKIVNISFQVDLFLDKKFPQAQIISQVITTISSYMDINKFDMGENIYLSNLLEAINNVGGVLNVIDLRVYNLVGGKYSINEITQPYVDNETRQIDISNDYALFGEATTMYEIKYPATDIIVRSK
jgi:hypothetical protein